MNATVSDSSTVLAKTRTIRAISLSDTADANDLSNSVKDEPTTPDYSPGFSFLLQ